MCKFFKNQTLSKWKDFNVVIDVINYWPSIYPINSLIGKTEMKVTISTLTFCFILIKWPWIISLWIMTMRRFISSNYCYVEPYPTCFKIPRALLQPEWNYHLIHICFFNTNNKNRNNCLTRPEENFHMEPLL